jgi:hypothetical protein
MRPAARPRLRAGLGAASVLVVVALGAAAGAGCTEECCTIDSLPIRLARAPLMDGSAAAGALLAVAQSGAADQFLMVLDSGSPITVLASPAGSGASNVEHRDFDLRDALSGQDPAPLRAEFRDIALLELPLGPVGAAATQPLGIFGGDLAQAFSVELHFAPPATDPLCQGAIAPAGAAPGCSSVTLWRHQGASDGFLEDAGIATVHFALAGGGEVTTQGDPDFLGLRGPLQLPPTRIALRTCAVPDAFVPDSPQPSCGARGCEVTRATGVDLALVVATGVGPLVLGEAAWARVSAELPAPPVLTPAPLLVAGWPAPIVGPDTGGVSQQPLWTTIPRLALVDEETGPNDDLGPCVDLGRARRLEWVSYHQVHPELLQPTEMACVEVCDTDTRQPDLAQNSAAYLEIGGDIPVAVVADDDPFLQSVRFDVRPEGPEVDGLLGAGALGRMGGGVRMEIDYLSTPKRALFSCEPDTDRASCWAAARCPRLPDETQQHLCFGLGPHNKPATCAPAACLPAAAPTP